MKDEKIGAGDGPFLKKDSDHRVAIHYSQKYLNCTYPTLLLNILTLM